MMYTVSLHQPCNDDLQLRPPTAAAWCLARIRASRLLGPESQTGHTHDNLRTTTQNYIFLD